MNIKIRELENMILNKAVKLVTVLPRGSLTVIYVSDDGNTRSDFHSTVEQWDAVHSEEVFSLAGSLVSDEYFVETEKEVE